MPGVPFIGENGYYPSRARGSGRWVYQRILVVIGPIGFAARDHADRIPAANQVIVWVPPRRGLLKIFSTSAMHKERQNAIAQLSRLSLMCYDECGWSWHLPSLSGQSQSSPFMPSDLIQEHGLSPDKWFLVCPKCGESPVGPDIRSINPKLIIKKWELEGSPMLENPGAGIQIRSASPIDNLPSWIESTSANLLELAYVGQQLWPNLSNFLNSMPREISE